MDTPRMPPDDRADPSRLRSLLDQIDAMAGQPRTRSNRRRSDMLCEEAEALIGLRIQIRDARARTRPAI